MMGERKQRDSHFAHRFVRILHKSCAAQDIGRDACLLLCFIAHTEDAARYSGPVRFWNSQFLETMAFNSLKQLRVARQKAVDEGWLIYGRKNNRSVGNYKVVIPERFSHLSDAPMEEPERSHADSNQSNGNSISGPNGTSNQSHKDPNKDRFGFESGTDSGSNCGPTPNPIPIPNPNKKRVGKKPADYSEDFESFWKAFPPNRKTSKGPAWDAWLKALERTTADVLIAAAKEYALSDVPKGDYCKGPAPWLNQRCWEDDRAAWSDGPRAPTDDEVDNWRT